MKKIACVDLFCGAGGLTHGFVLEGLPVVAGIDLDPACRYPYVTNNHAQFLERDISKVTAEELQNLFGDAELTVLAGCAPCQPFSTYAQRYEVDGKDGKWGLLYEFARLTQGASPDVIASENVPKVTKNEAFCVPKTEMMFRCSPAVNLPEMLEKMEECYREIKVNK